MLVTLDELLLYRHSSVVARYKKEHPESAHRADEIFSDLLRFFWASKKHNLDREQDHDNPEYDFVFIMDDEMRNIDQMWHVFLLYTEDYTNFCRKYFGEYLHHLPDIVPNMEEDTVNWESNLEKFLSYVFDHLGEPVVRRWFPVSCGQSA